MHWSTGASLVWSAQQPPTLPAAAPARLLAERLADATVAAGFAPDVKPFRAHLTLARKVQAARAAECEWPRALAPPLTVHCERFALMQSRRGETGSIYSVVEFVATGCRQIRVKGS